MKKTFDAVAFMRKRREELSRAYAGLNAEQIAQQLHQALKDNPLWKQSAPAAQTPSKSKKRTADRP